MQNALRRALALLAAASLVAGLWPTAPSAAQDATAFIVRFEQPPAILLRAAAQAAGRSFDVEAYEARLFAQQDQFLEALRARGVPAAVVTHDVVENGAQAPRAVAARWAFALNGMAIQAPASALAAIQSMPGVAHVEPDRQIEFHLAESVPYVRAPETWRLRPGSSCGHGVTNDPATTGDESQASTNGDACGQGQAVAVIDSGIDWTHPEFTSDPSKLPGPGHDKVKFWANYEGIVAGVNGPVGTDDFGHGSHVASTIAGDDSLGYASGVAVDGRDVGQSRFEGVAPRADLWAYKVCGPASSCPGNVLSAINDAAKRGATVLNLSLGSTNDDPYSSQATAINNVMSARPGSVVAVSAGNSGPGYSTIGTPATGYLALTVGAATDPGDNQYFVQLSPTGKRLEINLFSNSPAPPNPPIQSDFVYVGLGCTPADYAGKTPVAGRIALIERGSPADSGTCTFTLKATLAQEQGAVGALIFNNVDGNFSGSMEKTRIPVGALSQADGSHLVGYTDPLTGHSERDGVLSTIKFDPEYTVIAGRITGFSSRGPTGDFRIKPDVVAPGNSVMAATTKVGVPTQSMQNAGGYTSAGGTSMASPHVAGAAALLRQLHPDWSPLDVKNALMNTAVLLTEPADGKPYSVLDQGAGLIDVHAAATTKGLLTALNKFRVPDGADADDDPDTLIADIASYSYGEVENYGGRVTRSVSFKIRDVSGTARTYSLAFQPGDGKNRGGWGRTLPADGFSASLSTTQITVPANGEAGFTLTIAVDGTRLRDGDYEGRVVATAADQTLRAPILYRSVHRQPAPAAAPVLADPSGVSRSGNYELDWSDVAAAIGYRLQEATSLSYAVTDDANGPLGSVGPAWKVESDVCNSLFVDACVDDAPANPLAWTRSTARSHGGESYRAFQGKDQNNRLVLARPVAVPAGVDVTLSYWTWFDTEPTFDFGYVEASTDGVNWSALDHVDGLSTAVVGSQDGWVHRSVDLSAYAGGALHLRFRYASDPLCDLVGDPVQCADTGYEGWYLDDIALTYGNWRTIAEPRRSDERVNGRPNGTYYYRVAALVNTVDANRAVTAWSNVADVTVQRGPVPTPRAATPAAPSADGGALDTVGSVVAGTLDA
ncbi:MAG TPA: S8 family serine peptidase, partial [Chloroflexota bacterium]|nr:S8 family serine peptidase [Chloroflexota bacterium]